MTVIKTGIFLLLAALLAENAFAQELPADVLAAPAKRGSIGLGWGLPYGGLGVNADVCFFDVAALTAGVGSFGRAAGFSVGGKYFHGSPNKTWRPQIALLYGVNKVLVIEDEVAGDRTEAFRGFTVGLGSQFMFGKAKKHGFDLDLLYIVSSGVFQRVEDLEQQGYQIGSINRFTFSLGYRYALDFQL